VRCELSRVARKRMAGVKMPRLTEVESQCFRCDHFGTAREDDPAEQITMLAPNKLRPMLPQ
jgi:hypothetical protein